MQEQTPQHKKRKMTAKTKAKRKPQPKPGSTARLTNPYQNVPVKSNNQGQLGIRKLASKANNTVPQSGFGFGGSIY